MFNGFSNKIKFCNTSSSSFFISFQKRPLIENLFKSKHISQLTVEPSKLVPNLMTIVKVMQSWDRETDRPTQSPHFPQSDNPRKTEFLLELINLWDIFEHITQFNFVKAQSCSELRTSEILTSKQTVMGISPDLNRPSVICLKYFKHAAVFQHGGKSLIYLYFFNIS